MKKIITVLLVLFCINSNAQSAEELYKKGVEYFRNNQFQNAKNTFEQSFKLNPDFKTFGMYVLLSRTSENFEGLSGKNNTLQYTLKLHSLNKIKSVYFFNVINEIYLQTEKAKLNPTLSIDEKKIALNIEKSIDKTYNENPTDFSTNLNKVMSFVSQPNLRYSKEANSYQIDCNFWFNYGKFTTDKNFNNLVKIRPDSETGYLFRGCIRGEKGVDDFKTVLKLNPNNALSNFLLYGILLDNNDFSGGINNLSKAFKIEPNKVIESIKIDGSELEMLFLYVKYYLKISSESNSKYVDFRSIDSKYVTLLIGKNYSEALRICNELIEEDKKTLAENIEENLPENVSLKKVYYYKGVANFNLEKYEDAITDFNHIIERDQSISDAFAMRGAVKISLNDFNGALIDLNKAIELDNSDGYMYFYRGLAQNKLEDTNSACIDLKKALELGYEEARETLKEICK
jgi:tetratricopeptide (TPR) repeat protein